MQLQFKDAFSLNTDALFSQFGSDFHQQDCFEQFPIENAMCWSSKWPGWHFDYFNTDGVWLQNKYTTTGIFYGTIYQLDTWDTDISFDRVAGQFDNDKFFSIWTNFGSNLYTPALSTGSLVTSGAIHDQGKFMAIDVSRRIFFIPRGYALYFDGAVNGKVLDYGRFVISKSISAGYGGSYTNYLSPVGPIAKWDGSYRFGSVISADGINTAAAGASNFFSSFLPICVNSENDFCYFLPPVCSNLGTAVFQSPMLYSVLLPCFCTDDTIQYLVNASAQFHGKRFIPKQSGVMAVPYLGLNAL